MLNVGPLELLVVLAVALVVVGPERLPELARSVGRALRQFRQVQDEVRDMVSMGVDDEVRQAATDLKKVSSSIKRATDVKGAVKRAEQGIAKDVEGAAPRTSAPVPAEPRSHPEGNEAEAEPTEPSPEPTEAAPEPPPRP
jgi:Tat protein translocase TatB subunit